MATYYWVGGTGTWSNTSNTNWATSSGGSGGAGIPTSGDDVIFNSSSNTTSYVVTVSTGAVCRDFTTNGPGSGTVTFSGTTLWTIYGNFTLAATGVTINRTGAITFAATTTGNIITTNGVSVSSGDITFSGSGSYSLGGAFTTTGNAPVYFTAGSFDTSNYNMTIRNGIIISGTAAITLGSSTITIPLFVAGFYASGSSTISAGTSVINLQGTQAVLDVGGRTLYEVNFSGLGAGSVTSIYGVTLTNLKLRIPSGSTSPGGFAAFLYVYSDITVTGTLSTYNYQRAAWRIALIGMNNTVRTVTAAAVSISNIDFQRITAAGVASPFTGSYLSDRGNNTNITFTPAKTVYWNLAGTQSWDAIAWANTSGGTPNANNGPLLQDTAIIDNAGAANTITMIRNGAYAAIDASGRTTAWSISMSDNSLFAYGNLILGSAVSGQLVDIDFIPLYSNNLSIDLLLNVRQVTITGTGTQTARLLRDFTVTNFGGTGSITVSNTAISTNNYNVTAKSISITSGTQTVDFSNSTITCTGTGTVFNLVSANLQANSSTIVLSDATNSSSRTFAGGGKSYGNVAFNGGAATSQTIIVTGSNSFANVTSNKTVAWTLRFTGGTTNSFGAWTITGSTGNTFTLNSTTGTPATLTYTGSPYVSFNFATVTGISGRPANFKWFAGANSTNGGNNSAVYFINPIDPTLGNFLLFT